MIRSQLVERLPETDCEETLPYIPGPRRDEEPKHISAIGPYSIEGIASSGGFGVVYRATDASGGRVALKVLHANFTGAEGVLRRFRQEVELVQRIRHPGIVKVLSLGETPGAQPFIAMEWLDGATLSSVLKARGAFEPKAALDVMTELCSALSAVHEAGVVHRDLKGSNVMVIEGEDGLHAKLLDFGVAKLLDEDSKLTRTGVQVGTPGYMAPEQILGQIVGPPTDVYALGILLFQMLTARHPFTAKSVIDVEALHLSAPPPRVSDFASVPEALSDVIERCLAKAPADRYPSVEELLEDLRVAVLEPARVTPPLRAEERTGAAIVVEVEGRDEAELSRRKAAMRRVCEAEGFAIACDEDQSLGAVVALPRGQAGARALRARALRLALRLVRMGQSSGVRGAAKVHAARVVTLRSAGRQQVTGGDLLDFEAWAQQAEAGSVLASAQAVADLEDVFAAEPRGARAQTYRVSEPDRDAPRSLRYR